MAVQFDFSEALALLKLGKRVRRLAWGKVVFPTIKLYQEFPYIRNTHASGEITKWDARHNDILATDWVLVEEEGKAKHPPDGG